MKKIGNQNTYKRTCDDCGCMDMCVIVHLDGYRRRVCFDCLPRWVEQHYDDEEECEECFF